MKKKISFILLSFFLVFSCISCGRINENDIKANNNSKLNNFFSLKEKEYATIYTYESTIGEKLSNERIIMDRDHELLDFLKNINYIEPPKGIGNWDNHVLTYGDHMNSAHEYMNLFSYQLIEIVAEYQFPYACNQEFYGVTEEDGKAIFEKTKEIILKEDKLLKEERNNFLKEINFENFVNSNYDHYKYSLNYNLDNYKYVDNDKEIIKILKDMDYQNSDKSVYEAILRYGYEDEFNKFDFILDESYEKITFRKEKLNRYNIPLLMTKSYKINKEDGIKIYNTLNKREVQ